MRMIQDSWNVYPWHAGYWNIASLSGNYVMPLKVVLGISGGFIVDIRGPGSVK